MKNALNILRTEHRSISAVLHGLARLARDAQNPAVRPHFAVFRAVLRYIDSFPERLHHSKADEFLFRPVIARAAEALALPHVADVDHLYFVALDLGVQLLVDSSSAGLDCS